MCYQHGSFTYKRDIAACNRGMYDDMSSLCRLANNNTLLGRAGCWFRPGVVKVMIDAFGSLFHQGSETDDNLCEYDAAGFLPPRDRVLVGRFALDGSGGERIVELQTFEATVDCPASALSLHLFDPVNHSPLEQQVCLTDIDIAYDQGQSKNLATLGLKASDLLSHSPIVARLAADSQQLDNIVLLAFHRRQDGGGLGVLMIPIDLSRLFDTRQPRPHLRAFQAGYREPWDKACDVNHLNCQLADFSENELDRQQEAFEGPILVGHVINRCLLDPTLSGGPCADGQQLVLPSLASLDRAGMALRVYAFTIAPDKTFDLLGIQKTVITDDRDPTYGPDWWKSGGLVDPECQVEIYKRFQHTPLLFDADNDGLEDLHFLFRDKNDPNLLNLVVRTYFTPRTSVSSSNARLGIGWVDNDKCPQSSECAGNGLNVSTNVIEGWTRETYPWFALPTKYPHQQYVAGVFLSNCSDVGGKTCGGAEHIIIRMYPRKYFASPPVAASPDARDVQDFSLAPVNSDSLPADFVSNYMRLPVLAGRFGPRGEPGIAFVWAGSRSDQRPFTFQLLRTWRSQPSVVQDSEWQAEEVECPLDNAADLLRISPMVAFSPQHDGPAQIVIISRDASATSGLAHRVLFSEGSNWLLTSAGSDGAMHRCSMSQMQWEVVPSPLVKPELKETQLDKRVCH